ncbi:MAG: zinc transporter ZupT [Elusimicrobiota bacterium]|jgi:ZIP family zinc transporter
METAHGSVLFAFALTALAGLSTGIGSAIAFFARRTNTRLLAFSLAFSAGVMVFISLFELLPESRGTLAGRFGPASGAWAAFGAFFVGIAFTALIDFLVPSFENPHEHRHIEEMEPGGGTGERRLMRMGLLSAFALTVHNIPEGLATFVAALNDPTTGLSIALAIAIHNVPEGISVSVPIFYATGDRRKAFLYSFATGLAELVGAALGYLLLAPFIGPTLFGLAFAFVAGIMVFISFDELLPAAHDTGDHHLVLFGLLAGMGVMFATLNLFPH